MYILALILCYKPSSIEVVVVNSGSYEVILSMGAVIGTVQYNSQREQGFLISLVHWPTPVKKGFDKERLAVSC